MAEFPPCQPTISVHNFSHVVMETKVEFQVTRLQGQTMVWVGAEPKLTCLAAAVPVREAIKVEKNLNLWKCPFLS